MDGIYVYIYNGALEFLYGRCSVYIYIYYGDQTNPVNGMNHALRFPVPELDGAKTCRPYFDCRNT